MARRCSSTRPGSSSSGATRTVCDQDIKHIVRTFHADADVEKYAWVVPLAEIERDDWNLNISHYYMDTSEEEGRIDFGNSGRLSKERVAAGATMNWYLGGTGK